MKGFGVSIYGKGGIGKSTVSANLSCALAEKGNRVLLIGCDPKHDTTRQIAGSDMPTVAEYAVRVLPSQRRLDDIVRVGRRGIRCIEAGGPKPGVGCAGKGIVTMFQILEKLDDGSLDSDIVVYDVLGDVVCGGFSVPMRPKYTGAVLVVTSGEPMAIYAANNILRGTLGFESGAGRVAGIVLNRRGTAGEDGLVKEFSRIVGVPVVASFDRSDIFVEAERSMMPAVEKYPSSDIASEFSRLADLIDDIKNGQGRLWTPMPMTDTEFDVFMRDGRLDGCGTYRAGSSAAPEPPAPTALARLKPRRIGKGGPGAIMEVGRITDVPVIIHGTDSCAVSGFDELMSRRIRSPEGLGTGENLSYSIIGLQGSVFGGRSTLEESLDSLIRAGHTLIIVVSTCLSNMIGEDAAGVVRKVENDNPGTRIVLIEASRVDAGYDGHMEALKAVAELVDPDVESDRSMVTVVDDSFLHLERGRDLEHLDRVLNGMGLVRTRGFLEDCTAEDVRCLKRASVAVLGEDRRENRQLRRILSAKGLRFMERPLPRGLSETVPWLEELGRLTGRASEAGEIADSARREYGEAVLKASEVLKDVRVAIIPGDDAPTEWIVEALEDSGAAPETVNPPAGPVTGIGDGLKGYGLVIGDDRSVGGFDGPRMPMPATSVTHLAQMDLLRRACCAMRSSRGDGWTSWREPL